MAGFPRFEASRGRPRIVVVPPRPQHYIQTFCHSCVYAYWGYYWPPVYDFFPLLAGQLLFAYAFDMLLAWSRGEDYQLGWGPVSDRLQHQPVPLVQGRRGSTGSSC